MSDISILIQGPLDKTSLSYLDYYKTIGPVVISHWDNDDLSLLNSYDLSGCKIIFTTPPEKGSMYNRWDTFILQVISIMSGLRGVDTPYVLKTRSDERYGNLNPLIEKFNINQSKIVCGNIFFKKWDVMNAHIGDHLYIGSTDLLLESYINICKFHEVYDAAKYPEQILVWAIMHILLNQEIKRDDLLTEKDEFMKIFDIVDINKMTPFIAKFNYANMEFIDIFEFKYIIKSMGQL